MAGRWLMEPCEGAMAGMEAVETLLDLPLLQRLALHRAVELEILETDDSLEIVQVAAFHDHLILKTCLELCTRNTREKVSCISWRGADVSLT